MIRLITHNHVKVFYLQIQTIVNRFEHLVVLRWPRQPSDVERVDDLWEERLNPDKHRGHVDQLLMADPRRVVGIVANHQNLLEEPEN